MIERQVPQNVGHVVRRIGGTMLIALFLAACGDGSSVPPESALRALPVVDKITAPWSTHGPLRRLVVVTSPIPETRLPKVDTA